MSFVSLAYLGFLPAVVAATWSLPARARNGFLVAASLGFYGWFTAWWIALLVGAAALDFGNALAMERWPARKGAFLALSVVGNLGLLGVFKYFDFFSTAVAAGLRALGLAADPVLLHLVLPVGISFYTFQSLAYTTDVYRGKARACRSPVDFLLFVAFFPQLVAGPISRAGELLPAISGPRPWSGLRFREGLSLLAWGAVQKVVLGDTLRGFVEAAFADPAPGGALIWTAAAAANLQMFADFAGYTNLARGSGKLLGVDLPENFRAPFLSRTPSEWWTRWHMTFYAWIRDYVFQPVALHPFFRRWLSGPGRPPPWVHPVRGLVVSLVLSGLWHGAETHFVVWGAWFAVVQVGYFAAGRLLPKAVQDWPHAAWVQRPLMVPIFCVSAILFHEPDLGRIGSLLVRVPWEGSPADWARAAVLAVVALAVAAPLGAAWWARERWGEALAESPLRLPLETLGWTLAAWAVFVFAQDEAADFDYVRF